MRPVVSQANKAHLKEAKEEEEEKGGKLGVQQYMMFDAEESEEEEELKHQQWTPYVSKKVYTFSAQAHEEERMIQ